MSLRSWLLLGLLLGTSCDALFGGLSRTNPKNCVATPGICGATETCDPISERCVGISPTADLFAPLSLPLDFRAQHVLFGNQDRDSQIDVVLVSETDALVLYNPGSSLTNQRSFRVRSTPGPLYAQLSDVDTNGLDDLLIIDAPTTGDGTISICLATGPDSPLPFACLEPRNLRFAPKAVLVTDLIGDSKQDLAAVDKDGAVLVCSVDAADAQSPTGICETILPAGSSEPPLYAQLALVDDLGVDGRRDVGVLIQPMAGMAKLRILRSNSAGSPSISDATLVPLGNPVLVAGSFNQSGKLGLATIGSASNDTIVTALPFFDLSGTAPVASPVLAVRPGALFGTPTTARACAAGQFDGVGGAQPDDIACQLSDGQLALFAGSTGGLQTVLPPAPLAPIPGSHVVAAPFSFATAGRHDLLVYSDAQLTGSALVSLVRSAGKSPRGMFTRTTLSNTNTDTPPDYLLLTGDFEVAGSHQLALLPRGGSSITRYARDPDGLIAQPSAAAQRSLPGPVETAGVLPCGDGVDLVAIAYRNDPRLFLYRFKPGAVTENALSSPSAMLQVQAADVNGDGLADLIALRSDGTVQAALAQSNTCTLAPLTDLIPNAAPQPVQLALGDVNSDGWADVVVRGERGGLRVFRNGVDMAGKPRGVFELAAETSLPLELTAGQMAIGEVRRKGQSVILISMMPATGNSQLYELTLGADGKSLSLNKSTVSTLVRSPTLALRDFNQDGLAEALLLDAEAGILSVTSWGQDENGRVRPFYVGIRPSGLATGLVDSDALPDVAVLTQMSKMTPTPIGLSIAYGLAAGELK